MKWLGILVLVLLLLPTSVLALDYADISITAKPPSIIPTVEAGNVTNITATSAVLHATVSAGGENVTRRGFEWGLSSGNYTWSWNETGSFQGEFEHQITELSYCTEYFWRAFAENEVGQGNSTEQSFWTSCTPFAPTNFVVRQSGPSSVDITWNIGEGAEYTVIIGNNDRYPRDVGDGYVVYNGTDTSCAVGDLSLWSTTYYFRAWSWNSYGYSDGYAEGKIGGAPMIALVVGIICLGATALGFVIKQPLILLCAGIGWTILGAMLYDTNTAIMILCICFALVCFVWPLTIFLRERRSRPSPEDEDYESYRQKVIKTIQKD